MLTTAAKLLKLSPFIEIFSLEGSYRGLIEVYQMIKIFPRMLRYAIFIWKSVLSKHCKDEPISHVMLFDKAVFFIFEKKST